MNARKSANRPVHRIPVPSGLSAPKNITRFVVAIAAMLALSSCVTPLTGGQKHFISETEGSTRLIIKDFVLERSRLFSFNHVLLDTTNRNTIEQWRAAFDIKGDQHVRGFWVFARYIENCDCSGDYEFTFMKNQKKSLCFTLHHMSHLRCDAIYDGHDAHLNNSSIEALQLLFGELNKGQNESR